MASKTPETTPLSVQHFVNRWVSHFAPEGLEARFPHLVKSKGDARSFRGRLGHSYKLHVLLWGGDITEFACAYFEITRKNLPLTNSNIKEQMVKERKEEASR